MQPVNWDEFAHSWAEGSMRCRKCKKAFKGVRFLYSCHDKVDGEWPKCCGELTDFCDDWKPDEPDDGEPGDGSQMALSDEEISQKAYPR